MKYTMKSGREVELEDRYHPGAYEFNHSGLKGDMWFFDDGWMVSFTRITLADVDHVKEIEDVRYQTAERAMLAIEEMIDQR